MRQHHNGTAQVTTWKHGRTAKVIMPTLRRTIVIFFYLTSVLAIIDSLTRGEARSYAIRWHSLPVPVVKPVCLV